MAKINEVELKVALLDKTCVPYKKYETDSAMDLKARITQLISISQHSTVTIPTGIRIELPVGYEAVVRPRSGLSSKGVIVTLGTIDNEYRGELAVIITNTTVKPYHVTPYERIAQLAVQEVIIPRIRYTDGLSETERGANGFGSTGKV